jgi:hypothetical protein
MLVENLLEYRNSDQLLNDSNISFTSEIRNTVEILLEVESTKVERRVYRDVCDMI